MTAVLPGRQPERALPTHVRTRRCLIAQLGIEVRLRGCRSAPGACAGRPLHNRLAWRLRCRADVAGCTRNLRHGMPPNRSCVCVPERDHRDQLAFDGALGTPTVECGPIEWGCAQEQRREYGGGILDGDDLDRCESDRQQRAEALAKCSVIVDDQDVGGQSDPRYCSSARYAYSRAHLRLRAYNVQKRPAVKPFPMRYSKKYGFLKP